MRKLRVAKPQDFSAIYSLSSALAYTPMPAEIARDQLLRLLESDSNKIWLVEVDKKIVAWIHVFIARRVASLSFC